MKFGAIKYARGLRVAPDGSVLTPAEKLLLCAIAQDYREELGFAFPSSGRLVELTGCLPDEALAEAERRKQMENRKRSVRRLLAGLEVKGVLRRHAATRDRDSSQSSNEYEFAGYSATVVDAARRKKVMAETFRVSRSRRAPGVAVVGEADLKQRKRAAGAGRPAGPVQKPLPLSSPPGHGRPPTPGHGCPPIESYEESYADLPPQCPRQNGANVGAIPDMAKARARATASAKATATTPSLRSAEGEHGENVVSPASVAGAAGGGKEGHPPPAPETLFPPPGKTPFVSRERQRWRRGRELERMQLDGDTAALGAEVARVMRECGFTPGPLELVIADALTMRVAAAKCSIAEAGDLAIRRWREYVEAAPMLRYAVGAKKFFREGIWLAPKAWPYDGRKVEEFSRSHRARNH